VYYRCRTQNILLIGYIAYFIKDLEIVLACHLSVGTPIYTDGMCSVTTVGYGSEMVAGRAL
jgi:hypothetical protein